MKDKLNITLPRPFIIYKNGKELQINELTVLEPTIGICEQAAMQIGPLLKVYQTLQSFNELTNKFIEETLNLQNTITKQIGNTDKKIDNELYFCADQIKLHNTIIERATRNIDLATEREIKVGKAIQENIIAILTSQDGSDSENLKTCLFNKNNEVYLSKQDISTGPIWLIQCITDEVIKKKLDWFVLV